MRFQRMFFIILGVTFHGGIAAAAPIRLPDGRQLKHIDFERHVHALLDRQGCNAGKCHGNRDGQGGFSLSLFAAESESDFHEITRHSHGRYVNPADPAQSLLLLKATGQARHGGDIRVKPGSWEYQVLREWIAQGARREPGRGRIKSIQVVPREHVFQVGETLQLKALAEFADGTSEDVTRFCDFRLPASDRNNPIAPAVRVNATGAVVAVMPGDVTVSVVYRGQARGMRARVAVPVAKDYVYPKIPEVNFIDAEVFGQLRRLNIVPADLSSDEQFLRRVTLDLIGTIPNIEEVQSFRASRDPDKRAKKIDELLAHPLHAALLAIRFCELTGLVGAEDEARTPRNKGTQMAHAWFRKRLHENMPYDRIVAGVLTATSREGRGLDEWRKEKQTLESMDTGFVTDYPKRATLDFYWRDGGLLRAGDPIFGMFNRADLKPTEEVDAIYLQEIAERTASAFMGMTLECARCHVHPLDGWTPTDYRAFANVFGQVRLEKFPFKHGTMPKWERAAFTREVFVGDSAILLKQPDLENRRFLADVSKDANSDVAGAVGVKPRLPGGPEVDFRSDARQTLMKWLADPENPYFARHFVDVLWRHYFGVSLAHATDGFTSAHGQGNHPVLDRLAKEFIKSKFDIRHLERTMLLSRTYQLSSIPNETNKHDRTNFSRTVPRQLNARVLTEIVHVVLESRETYGPGVPPGIHANEIAHVASAFYSKGYDDGYGRRITGMVHQFGRGDLVSRCTDQTDLRSRLHIYGSSESQRLLDASKRIQRLAKSAERDLDPVLDEAFLVTLGRLPTEDTRKYAKEHLQRDWPDRRKVVAENLYWWLINIGEFVTRR